MRIAIHSSSGTQVGGGHVMRCLSLAMASRGSGHEARFISTDVAGHLGDRISQAGFNLSWISPRGQVTPAGDIET